jgi:hypothetical protein
MQHMLLADLARLMDSLNPRLIKAELVPGKMVQYTNEASKDYVVFSSELLTEDTAGMGVITVIAPPPVMYRMGLSYDKSSILVPGEQGLDWTDATRVVVQYEERDDRMSRGRDFLTLYPEHLSAAVVRDALKLITGALQA